MRNTHTIRCTYLLGGHRYSQQHATPRYDASKIIFMLFMLSQDVIPQPLIP